MSDLTAAQLAYLHSELGTTLDEADMQLRYDRISYVTGVALEVAKERLASMLAKSASLTLTGVMSRDNSANIKALQEQVTRLTAAYNADLGAAGEPALAGAAATSLVVGRRDRLR